MGTEWLCAQIYPGHWDLCDTTIQRVIRPARVEAIELGIERWFFIRYLDSFGPHLRLRVRGQTDAINAVHDRWRKTLASRMIRPDSSLPFTTPEVLFVPYEPEFDKYGGPVGVDCAERAFERSSDAVLDLIDLCPAAGPRLAVTTLVMQRVARCVPQVDRATFWKYHAHFWSTADGDPASKRPFAAATDAALNDLEAHLGSTPSVDWLVTSIADATAAAITEALTASVRLTPAHLLLHHLHMTVNRLGVLPAQEARLGRRISARRPL